MSAGRPHKCPYCGGTDTTSKGARKTKTMGIRRIRCCKGCGRRFTPKSQKSVQAETPKLTQPEASESKEAQVTPPVEPCVTGPADPQPPTSVAFVEPSDEHPRFGL